MTWTTESRLRYLNLNNLKLTIKQWLTLITAIILHRSNAIAYDFVANNIYYEITSSYDRTLAVTFEGSSYDSYTNEYSGEIIIPMTIIYSGTTYSVTEIRLGAYYGCSGLTSITIPNSVTEIGSVAFMGCKNLII